MPLLKKTSGGTRRADLSARKDVVSDNFGAARFFPFGRK